MQKVMLYIDTLRRGGAQRVMANVANYLSNHGYEVILVRDYRSDDNFKEYYIEKEIKITYCDDKNCNLKRAAGKLWLRIWSLRRTIIEFQPDIILSFLRSPNLCTLLATMGLHIPKVVSVRNDPYYEYGKGLGRIIARTLFLLADGIVFQTNEAANYFSESVKKHAKIIANPVSEQFYDVKREESEFYDIVHVGRLQPQKNQHMLIEAFMRIEKELPMARLLIYGDGELIDDLKKIGNDKVHFMGNVKDIPSKLCSATMFVLSSDYEGMPNALMEAMAAGLPVVSTDCPCGGPRYLIQNEEQGVLIPCNDIQALADAMKKLLTNPNLRRQMGIAARKRAEAFRESVILQEWVAYLKEICKEQT